MTEIAQAIRFAAMLAVRAYAARFVDGSLVFAEWVKEIKNEENNNGKTSSE